MVLLTVQQYDKYPSQDFLSCEGVFLLCVYFA